MFKKKNKNLHRALIALMVLGLLVCLCFTLASAATAEPDSSSAAETTAVEEQGAQSNTEAMTNFLNQAGHPDPQCGLEIDRHDPHFLRPDVSGHR